MGLADYQKQKEIKAAAVRGAKASEGTNELLQQILTEQQRTNALLEQLVTARA